MSNFLHSLKNSNQKDSWHKQLIFVPKREGESISAHFFFFFNDFLRWLSGNVYTWSNYIVKAIELGLVILSIIHWTPTLHSGKGTIHAPRSFAVMFMINDCSIHVDLGSSQFQKAVSVSLIFGGWRGREKREGEGRRERGREKRE